MTRTQPVTIKSVSEPVIGHMGRLVADDRQASMFGGSTTGVHFISQTEQQLQLLQMHKDAFPSCAYGLYLHSPWGSSVQNPLTPAVSDLIGQLPPNTVEIVEATINRWTPLYPIVHKSSTIDAMQRLLDFYEATSSGIVVLYQILGLLALGTIGQKRDCTQQHHHFLCQFSSAYHGMPRLIRDQDVDTDLPTSVDHDLLSRTHVEFPLPGERSQVDTAIGLFKLARIIGRTLEDLYTTTRRRGGVSKIAHLQAELNMWERVVLEPEMDPELATPVVNMSLEAIFLRVAHCVATIHVHRPALSFTVADAQFIPSLKACGQASATLVRLLSAGLTMMGAERQGAEYPATDWPESLLVMLLYPNGIHMLWQAGLTILFAGWKGYPVTVDQDESLIQSCVETLRYLHTHTDDVGNHVAQCAEVLDLLRKKISSDLQVSPDLEQLQWNVWDWPMASALELANMLDTAPLDLDLDPERWL
ncbi:hypothetical protein N0V84_003152 [Fusarium piperis]|uniref:Uncharacterized protein n=1 Tax=Fusarium piperis TaxID=1435070 RepID=A0A9W9BSP4_9HYPO|nr:hypothetical protein N0V84_003152 [Fusarium piperis]